MNLHAAEVPASPYLALIQRLTALSPRWGIWKNADRALAGSGDIDSAAPYSEWGPIISEVRRWAGDQSLGPVAVCRHIPTQLFLFTLDQEHRIYYELDVLTRKYWRGWTMFRATDLLPLYHIDERGFREVRPGVEGLIGFIQNGTRWRGRSNMTDLKAVNALDLMKSDPEGVHEGAKLFGIPEMQLLDAIDQASAGSWDRSAMFLVEASAVLRAILQPHLVIGRLWAMRMKRRCPLLRSSFMEHRRVPADFDAWLNRVTAHHPVLNGTA